MAVQSSVRIKEWNGPEIERKIQRASMEAIDEITEEAAHDAGGSHWWRSSSGRLEANIVNEAADATATGARGRFGSTQRGGFYGLFLERKTPFLRPAADRHFPKLASAIRRRMK